MKFWELLALVGYAIAGEWAMRELVGYMGLRHLVWIILLAAAYVLGINRGMTR